MDKKDLKKEIIETIKDLTIITVSIIVLIMIMYTLEYKFGISSKTVEKIIMYGFSFGFPMFILIMVLVDTVKNTDFKAIKENINEVNRYYDELEGKNKKEEKKKDE